MKAIQHTNQFFCSNIQRMLGIVVMMVMAVGDVWGQTNITSLSLITAADGHYVITQDIDASSFSTIASFSGSLEANINPETKMPYRIKNLGVPMFTTLTGTVKNLVIENVSISQSGMVGAIACTANGAARIYNVGILAGSVGSTTTSGETSTGCCGGLVGFLDGEARVVNCYSYADITGGNRVGGIVGYNNVETKSNNLKTMVFACMFYGDITGGTNKAPIYNGKIITNRGDNNKNGVSNFNYFCSEASYVQGEVIDINTYNCALAAEGRFLQRFEFFRHLLNGHRELADWWATGTYSSGEMHKWVMIPDSIGTSHPYPVLKEFGRYPSLVNIDAEHATTGKPRNQGGKLGELTVNIQMGDGAVYNHPGTGDNEAKITTSQLTLNITDKDTTHFNFNYYKVQLPYYNDVGTKNYTGNRVVAGWKIVKINGSTTGTGTYDTGENVTYDANGNLTKTPYNFADRHCTNKDLYSVSKRVFNQGAYWDVPDGVTSITIEPYWAKCVYLADQNADKVYDKDMGTGYDVPNVGGGQIYTNGHSYSIAGDNQVVYTKRSDAISSSNNAGLYVNVEGDPNDQTVYDYAVVLVGNYHHKGDPESSNSKPYTFTSIDLDGDNEPDYSYIMRFDSRKQMHPVRVDFINIPGLGMAQKSHEGKGTYNFGIMQPIAWFESTNTSLFRETQFEYDINSRKAAPLILQGGVMEQWVNSQNNAPSNKTTYFHVGGNVWFKEFHRGTHQDKTYQTKHPPVSVTGGDYDQFYLTGLYTANVTSYDDNGECYINGGRFGKMAGAGMEGIGKASNNTGNITWLIDNADIKEFYAGGINAANGKTVAGNLHTIINNSHVDLFCGGPKFGDMTNNRTVVTTATDCTFGFYFGAGYGGNSYSRYPPYNYNNVVNIVWNDWVNGDMHVSGHDNGYEGFQHHYSSTYDGVDTQIDYQFIPMSGNLDNCARLWIEYVKFSLATAHSVTSTLTGCTIDSSFYGGGSLGKVDGPVKSVLDGCTVKGNVFGAGYSATLPKIPVMKTGGFIREPNYDENLGAFLPEPIFPDTVKFRWEHANTVNSTETAISEGNKILYTTENLSKSNLGSVSGNVELTLKGNTIVGTLENGTLKPNTGNVYGGGDESHVTKRTGEQDSGNTTVKLQQGAQVLGNVYGGGNNGPVEGDSEVIIQDETGTNTQP